MRITLAALAATLALSAAPQAAHARDGISPGAAAALGVLGGVAVGGAIASSQSNEGYYPGRRIYTAPPPVEREVVVVERPRRVVVEEDVGPVCHFERRRRVDEYGEVFFRRVRVCE